MLKGVRDYSRILLITTIVVCVVGVIGGVNNVKASHPPEDVISDQTIGGNLDNSRIINAQVSPFEPGNCEGVYHANNNYHAHNLNENYTHDENLKKVDRSRNFRTNISYIKKEGSTNQLRLDQTKLQMTKSLQALRKFTNTGTGGSDIFKFYARNGEVKLNKYSPAYIYRKEGVTVDCHEVKTIHVIDTCLESESTTIYKHMHYPIGEYSGTSTGPQGIQYNNPTKCHPRNTVHDNYKRGNCGRGRHSHDRFYYNMPIQTRLNLPAYDSHVRVQIPLGQIDIELHPTNKIGRDKIIIRGYCHDSNRYHVVNGVFHRKILPPVGRGEITSPQDTHGTWTRVADGECSYKEHKHDTAIIHTIPAKFKPIYIEQVATRSVTVPAEGCHYEGLDHPYVAPVYSYDPPDNGGGDGPPSEGPSGGNLGGPGLGQGPDDGNRDGSS